MSTLPYNPTTYNTPDVQVSPLPITDYFNDIPASAMPDIFMWEEGWFPHSGHVDPGYSTADPIEVAKQITDMLARGITKIFFDWYGPFFKIIHQSALVWLTECERQDMGFALVFDKGIFQFNVPAGTDMTAWGGQQMAFAVKTFCSSPAYCKTADGRFLMANYDCPSIAGLDMAKVLAPYPQVAMIYDTKNGMGKPGSAGCYAWLGMADMPAYQADFLANALKIRAANPHAIIGASFWLGCDDCGKLPGLDPTKSCWPPYGARRVYPQRQGQTLLDCMATLKAFIKAHPGVINFLVGTTWDDFDEGTALMRGVNSGLTVTLTDANGVLTATLNGNLKTVDHVEIHINGQVIGPVAPTAAPITYDLTSLVQPDFGSTNFFCHVVAVGRPLVQDKTSITVSTAGTRIPGQTIPVDVDVPVDNVVVQLDGTNNGITITGNLTWPINKVITKTVDAVVNTQIRWS